MTVKAITNSKPKAMSAGRDTKFTNAGTKRSKDKVSRNIEQREDNKTALNDETIEKVENSEDTSPKSSNTNNKKKCNNEHHYIHNKITKPINEGVDSKETDLKSKLVFLIDNNLLRYQTP
jgi:hypothetical protein